MNRRVLALVLMVVAHASFAAAQTRADGRSGPLVTEDRWRDVTGLPPGSRLRVHRSDGGVDEGVLQGVDEQQLTLMLRRAPAQWTRAAIRQVEREDGRRTKAGALTGLLVAAGAGALVGTLGVESSRGVWLPFLTATWGGVGALVGGAYGSTRPRYVPVYRAP